MEPKKELNIKLLASFFQRSYRDMKPVTLLEADVISATKSGDNFGSDVLRVKMKFICGSGKIKRRSMIVKTERDWKELKEYMHTIPIFRTEVKMYSSIFRLMEDLMEEFEDKRDTLWPTMYGFLPYNIVALEDLKEKEFEVADRKKSLDLKQATLALRSLARFHAMSMVLIGRGLLTKEDKGSYSGAEEGGIVDQLWTKLLTVFSDGIWEWGEEWHEISEKLRKVKDVAAKRMRDLALNWDPRFEVMNHGDIWLCNIMFRYLEYENIPIAVKFIDFQGSYAGSFIMDILNFTFTSVVPSIRRENTDLLLETYHESLRKNLEFFRYPGYVPTVDDVKNEWRRLYFGHLLFIGLYAITSAEEADVFDLNKLMTHPPQEVIKLVVFTDGKAKRSLGDDLKFYHKEGVF